jgi:hypothetical protein
MTLVRTALRLAAVNALAGATATSGPTIANNRVYDSRITDFNPESFPDDAKPTVIVLTDEDEGDQLSKQNGGPPFFRKIDLVFELGIVQKVQDGTTFNLIYPDTDPRLEAALDVLEFQITQRLGYDPDQTCSLFRKFFRPQKRDCHRQVLDDAGVKIACRVLTWTVDAPDDQVLVFNAADTVPTGIDALPDPLKTIAAALPAGSSGADIAQSIANALAALTAPALEGFDATIADVNGQDASDMFDVSVEIRSALDTPQTVATGANVTIDYSKGTFQQLILSADVTSLTVINWPPTGKTGRLILQITNTGNFSIAGWQNTEWTGGVAPTITQGAGKKDIVVLTTGSAGTEVFGNIVGQDYH